MLMIGNSPKGFPFRSNIDPRGVGIPDESGSSLCCDFDIYERCFLACPAPISRELSSIGAGSALRSEILDGCDGSLVNLDNMDKLFIGSR